ncbi:MAG: HAD family hydrolase [Gaiellales bacterium]
MAQLDPFSEAGVQGISGEAGALVSWNDGAAKQAILDFVERVTDEGGRDFVPAGERVAVFDNDGTLWCEQPMPVELGFVLRRLSWMAEADRSLRDRQPWKAAYENDLAWLGRTMVAHYAGDDSNAKVLTGGAVRAFAGMTVDAYAADAHAFLHERHPILGRRYLDCAFQPMVELIHYLAGHGFTALIASGGDRDFMRQVAQQMYGIPPDAVIGSTSAISYREDDDGGTLAYLDQVEVFDNGPSKPVRIWSRIGRRPVVACGNSNGDIPMLAWSGGRARTALRLLVLHDDPDREFAYTAGAERCLGLAAEHDWTVISVKNDWATVFADGSAV